MLFSFIHRFTITWTQVPRKVRHWVYRCVQERGKTRKGIFIGFYFIEWVNASFVMCLTCLKLTKKFQRNLCLRENKWIGRLTHDDLEGPRPPQLLPLEIDPKDFTGKAKVTPKSAHRPLDVTKIVKKKKKASWLCPHARSKSRRTGSHFHSKFSLHPVTWILPLWP